MRRCRPLWLAGLPFLAVASLSAQVAPLPLATPAMGLVGSHVSAALEGGYGCPNIGCTGLFGLAVGYHNRPWFLGAGIASVHPRHGDAGWGGGLAVRKLLRAEEGGFTRPAPALHAGLSWLSAGSLDQVDIPVALAISAALPAGPVTASPWGSVRAQFRVSHSALEDDVWRAGGGLSAGLEFYKASGGGGLLYWGGRLAFDLLVIDGPAGEGPVEWSVSLSVLRRKF